MSVASSSSIPMNGNHVNGANGHGSDSGNSELANGEANGYMQSVLYNHGSSLQDSNEDITEHHIKHITRRSSTIYTPQGFKVV